jgi:hypothetical protein
MLALPETDRSPVIVNRPGRSTHAEFPESEIEL